jgi:hypothetical protein
MTQDTRDDALAQVLDEAVRHLEPGPDRLHQIRRRGRKRRFVMISMAAAVAGLFVAAVIGTGVVIRARQTDTPGAGRTVPSTRPADTPTQPTPITYRDDAHRFSVTYPGSWFRASETLTPHLVDPLEILSLGTHQLRPGGQECWRYPVNALEDLGPTDAFLTIQEEHLSPSELESFPERPEHFSEDLGGPSEAPFCVRGGAADFFDRWIRFQDQGRGFYILVAIGNEASEETRLQVWATLDSLEFQADG